MLLAIDIGNTQTVIGLFGDDDAVGQHSSDSPAEAGLLDHWRIATNAERTSDEHALVVQEFLGFHGFSFDDDVDPPWSVDIALCGSRDRPQARVAFAVARPGVDCDAVLYDPRVGTFVTRRSPAATTTPTVGATLAAIRARLEAPPC